MKNNEIAAALKLMIERFGHDSLISLATLDGSTPAVRIIDCYYENGAFYAITYLLSNKMQQIEKNSSVAICGEWFTAHGVGENIGYIGDEKNAKIAEKLREAFSSWISNGHVDENDKNTIILRIQLTDGVLIDNGKRYEIDFSNI